MKENEVWGFDEDVEVEEEVLWDEDTLGRGLEGMNVNGFTGKAGDDAA